MAFDAKNYSPERFAGAISGVELENIHEDGVTIEFDGVRSSAMYGLSSRAVFVDTTRTPVKVTVNFMPDAPEIHLLLAKSKAKTLFAGASYYRIIGTEEAMTMMGCVFENKGAINRAVQTTDDLGPVQMTFMFGDSEEL